MNISDETIDTVALAIAGEVVAAWYRTGDGSTITGDDMRLAAKKAIEAMVAFEVPPPAGMVAHNGSDQAPHDWDGGRVKMRDGWFCIPDRDGSWQQVAFYSQHHGDRVEAIARIIAKATGNDPDSFDAIIDNVKSPMWMIFREDAEEILAMAPDSADVLRKISMQARNADKDSSGFRGERLRAIAKLADDALASLKG